MIKNLSNQASLGIRFILQAARRINTAGTRLDGKLRVFGHTLHALAEYFDWAMAGGLIGLLIFGVAGGVSISLHELEGAHIQFSASVLWLGVWLKR